MKTIRALILTVAVLISELLGAQGVGINPSGANPDPSAILDVSSTSQGTLLTRMSSVQRDAIVNPAEGLLIYNTDTKCYNYFDGSTWNEWCGTCTPQPSQANAGPDQTGVSGSSTTLSANTPSSGVGNWSIVSGSGGSFTDPGNPNSGFNGVEGSGYTLRWTVSNLCGSSQDDVVIAFSGSQLFGYTGSVQSFIVPSGVTSVTVKAWGGGGGAHAVPTPGAGGGFSQATIAVTGGESLSVYVGGGGAHGVDPESKGAGGGGGSGIKRDNTILLVAGGGSGNSNYGQATNTGVGGGDTGGDGNGGTGGTQSGNGSNGGSGNVAGSSGDGNNGGNGGTYNSQIGGVGGFGLGNGGHGGSYFGTGNGCGGGGGGGGYFGGGGGNGHTTAGGQSGGGGSGYVSGTNTITLQGSGSTAGNSTDPDYANNSGRGGINGLDGNPGMVIISW